jgi:tetratricopeptide (TPR) repeat protein
MTTPIRYCPAADHFEAVHHTLALLLIILIFGGGCKTDNVTATLLPVELPALDGLPEAAQEQLFLQQSRTQHSTETIEPAELGQEFGTLGQLLYTYDFLQAAEPAFRNAILLSPLDGRWPYYMGMLMRQKGDFEAAAGLFEQILEGHSDDVLARLRLAEALLELEQAEAAKQHLESVLNADTGIAYAYFLLGQIAYDSGDYETAVEHFETVLGLQPLASQVHASAAMAHRNLRNVEKTTYHLERRGQTPVQLRDPRVIELEAFKNQSGANALTRGQKLIDQGRYDEAIEVLGQAVETDSTNASTFLSRGVARYFAGDEAGAIEDFRHTLLIDPTKSKAHYNLGAIFGAAGKNGLAERHYRSAIEHNPRHGNAHLELADLLRRAGDCPQAVPLYDQALELMPGSNATRQHLAICHAVLGEYRAALTVLEDGLAASPDDIGFLDGIARLLSASPDAEARDGDRALGLAEKAVLQYQRLETLETTAMALAEVGRYEDAVKVQSAAILRGEQVGHQGYLAHMRRHLERYRQGLPCREPWPEFWYREM